MRIGKKGIIINVDEHGVQRMKAQGWQEVKETKLKSRKVK